MAASPIKALMRMIDAGFPIRDWSVYKATRNKMMLRWSGDGDAPEDLPKIENFRITRGEGSDIVVRF